MIFRLLLLYSKIAQLHLSWMQIIVMIFSAVFILISGFMFLVSMYTESKNMFSYLITMALSIGIFMMAFYAQYIVEMISYHV